MPSPFASRMRSLPSAATSPPACRCCYLLQGLLLQGLLLLAPLLLAPLLLIRLPLEARTCVKDFGEGICGLQTAFRRASGSMLSVSPSQSVLGPGNWASSSWRGRARPPVVGFPWKPTLVPPCRDQPSTPTVCVSMGYHNMLQSPLRRYWLADVKKSTIACAP